MRVGSSKPRIVALGGGTGLPIVLRGLRVLCHAPHPSRARKKGDQLTAIVTVADDGGSSGRLRREYGGLPPGDLRNCLLALATGCPIQRKLFDYRFNGNGELSEHSLGNLILTALSHLESNDVLRALENAGTLLDVRGRVLPASLTPVTLVAETEDGRRASGESAIATCRSPIARVWLDPAAAPALPQAVEAIRSADLVVIGPGSVYTSLIPVLLVPGIANALAACKAPIVLVMNLMTEPGETDGYASVDMVRAIQRHAPRVPINAVVLNDRPVPQPLLSRYAEQGAVPVPSVPDVLAALGCRPVQCDLLAEVSEVVRHDPHKVAHALLNLVEEGSLHE